MFGISYWTVGPTFDKLCGAAGIRRFTCHDQRDTFCTDLLRAGVNQKVTADLVGHSSPAVTARHYQLVDDEIADEALSNLPDVLPAKVG